MAKSAQLLNERKKFWWILELNQKNKKRDITKEDAVFQEEETSYMHIHSGLGRQPQSIVKRLLL